MRGRRALVGALAMVLAVAGAAAGDQINPGDLIVVDFGNGTLDDVNPITGASRVIASGFSNPQGLAIDSQGTIFVSDIGTSTIKRVNPTSGVVTTFSGAGIGSGPALNRPFQMAFDAAGHLLVAEGGTPNGNTTGVYSIDANGNRTLIAGNNGSSNNLFAQSLAGLAVNGSGSIFASAPTAHTIYSVGNGTATPLTTALSAPQGLAIGANGQLLAINGNPSAPAIWSINPGNGNATIVSDNNGIGIGPAFDTLRSLTVALDGTIYATEAGAGEIFRVDPTTGNRSVVAGNGVDGTTFGGLTYGIAVYPNTAIAPEPSSVALLALGGAGVVLVGRRRARRRPA